MHGNPAWARSNSVCLGSGVDGFITSASSWVRIIAIYRVGNKSSIYIRLHAAAPPPDAIDSAQAGIENAGPGVSILGLIPHQIRGFLAQFRNMLITGAAYDRCTGCSEIVSKKEAWDELISLTRIFRC